MIVVHRFGEEFAERVKFGGIVVRSRAAGRFRGAVFTTVAIAASFLDQARITADLPEPQELRERSEAKARFIGAGGGEIEELPFGALLGFVVELGLLREELLASDTPHCYLDGSMSPRARQAEVDRFQASSDIPVFLISLKAGGTGLNLTAADTVVHFDPWWNPAAEAQATDRAHRIGQTRVVTSYKLIASGTVEEKVLALQDEKRALLAGVFEASDAAAAKLSLADLKSLLT